MNITLEESTTEKISPILNEIIKTILSQCKSNDSIQRDFLFVLVVVLMIENGFYPLKNDFEMVDDIHSIDVEQLTKWKNSTGLIETVFIMKGFEGTSLKLIMSPLGSMALVNVVMNDMNSDTYSVCIPISRYVVSPQASTIPMIFRDLKHLSMTFKNKILSAVKSRILSYCGYPSASLIGLPEEVFYKLLLYLSITDIVRLSKICKRLKFLIDNQSLWHELYKRDFNNEVETCDDWKNLYREAYIKKQDSSLGQSSRVAGTMHDHMDYADFVSYIDNPLWDIII